MLRVEVLTKVLERAAQEGMLPELLQEMRELVLVNMEDIFCRSLTANHRPW